MSSTPLLSLHDVGYTLPDGRVLFSDLNQRFDTRPTGLVGRNGVGKTVLARVLAGQLTPSHGVVRREGRVHYLSQQVSEAGHASVAALAGVDGVLEALARIEAGDADPRWFEIVGDRWDMRQRLTAELAQHGLGHVDPDASPQQLSGGEAMRVALVGAFLSGADWLILDEPTNHLDAVHRAQLTAQIMRWPAGLIVVSHDRALLAHMAHIVELSPLGLSSYGGNYAAYAERKAAEQALAQGQLAQAKLQRRRELQALQTQRERQEKRQSQGQRQAKHANQAQILLDRQKERSEAGMGRFRAQQAAATEQAHARVREAAARVAEDTQVTMQLLAAARVHAQQQVLQLDQVVLPFGASAQPIDCALAGPLRVGLVGANGSGKSTLLRVMAGRLAPRDGQVTVRVVHAYLDQRMDNLDGAQSVLHQLLASHTGLAESVLRTRLAQLGLSADQVTAASGDLSGGERLKAALALALLAREPAQLLLLDEPSNHLDLPSLEALAGLLRQYPGALIVVSHDQTFLDELALDERWALTPQGLSVSPWATPSEPPAVSLPTAPD